MPRIRESSSQNRKDETIDKNSITSINHQPIQYKGANNYKFKAQIGEGAVGKVFQVIHNQTSELFALKRVSKQQAKLVSD